MNNLSPRFDPWSLLAGLKNKALSLGTMFMKAEAMDFQADEHPADCESGHVQRIKKVHVCVLASIF